jgi:hypothetical protein
MNCNYFIPNVISQQAYRFIDKIRMHLATVGAPVALQRRAVNRSTKIRTSLFNWDAHVRVLFLLGKQEKMLGVWPITSIWNCVNKFEKAVGDTRYEIPRSATFNKSSLQVCNFTS